MSRSTEGAAQRGGSTNPCSAELLPTKKKASDKPRARTFSVRAAGAKRRSASSVVVGLPTPEKLPRPLKSNISPKSAQGDRVLTNCLRSMPCHDLLPCWTQGGDAKQTPPLSAPVRVTSSGGLAKIHILAGVLKKESARVPQGSGRFRKVRNPFLGCTFDGYRACLQQMRRRNHSTT